MNRLFYNTNILMDYGTLQTATMPETTAEADAVLLSDPVIEYYKRFVDRNALRENLKLSVDQRLQKIQSMASTDKPRREPPSPDHPWQPVSDCGPNRTTDPIIELYKRDVDRTLLRENLRLTPHQRLLKLADFMQFVETLQAAGKRARETR